MATVATKAPGPDLGTTIRFFISSTFADFQVERDVLQRRVFPELRQLCAESGFRLQPIDLRWGVSEAAGTERQTLRICFDELERCRQLSSDFFLLIQLGERYGSYILPPQISAPLVDRLLPHLTTNERAAFEAAYRLDENAVPAEYVLLRAEGPHDTTDEALRKALARASGAAGVAETDRLRFEGSATHREIHLGLLGQPPGGEEEAGVLCAVRTFAGERVGPVAGRFAEQDPERAEQVRQLTHMVLTRVPDAQVLRYAVAWDHERGPTFDEDELAEAYLGLLRSKLEAVIAARTAARAAAKERGHDDTALANAAFEGERLAHFIGREGPLAAIHAYLATAATMPLVVTGPGGSGKSTLLAHVVKAARTARPTALILARYVGVTPGAERLRTLLDGLCADLAAAYGHELEPAHEDFERARAFRVALTLATAARPLILVVDALDQLGAQPVSLDWLPEALPPHVHLVVSLLDESDRPELATLQARQPAPALVQLDRMGTMEGDALLGRWLAEAGRSLQPTQRGAVLGAFAHEGRPLYLRLAFEEARRWHSFDAVTALPQLAPTIAGLVTARFERLEADTEHGPLLTGHSLGLLQAAKNGLAEDELLDVLAQDAGVRADLHRLSPNSPPIAAATPDGVHLPLPMALWARLYADLGPYLTEREADGARLLTYYHRQLADVAARRYLLGSMGRECHRALAHYFQAQPLLVRAQPNLRKLSELPTQEASGELSDELRATLTDVSFIERKISYQRTAGALEDLALAPTGDEALRDIAAALRLGAHVVDSSPNQAENQLHGRLPTDVVRELHDLPQRSGPWVRLDSHSLAPVGGPLIRTLAGHAAPVYACAFSPDGRLALSASEDKTLRVWDVARGQTLRVLVGHTDAVRDCVFSPDGRLALSASKDSTLRVWDVVSGVALGILAGEHSWDQIVGCAFSPDGRLALSACGLGDHTLRLWEVASGETLRTFAGHTESVMGCAFSPDGRLALSASWDETLRVWDVARGQTVHTLKGHTRPVRACAFSPDGTLVLSASDDHTLRLWDVASGQELHTLEGHTGLVWACAFSPDGTLALSAAGGSDNDDHTLRLWDVASGQELHTLTGHTGWVMTCAFSPDGALAVSSSRDRTLRVWDVASGQEVARFFADFSLLCCALSPRGERVVVGDASGVVHFLTIFGMHAAARSTLDTSTRPLDDAIGASTPATPFASDPHGETPSSTPAGVAEAPADLERRRLWWRFWR